MGYGEGFSLKFTPSWIVAVVCTVFVAISLVFERLLHLAGRKLKEKDRKPLFEALQKIKEELMLLGFISLLLTVFQYTIVKICVNESLMEHLLPCSLSDKGKVEKPKAGYCAKKGKVPILSISAMHDLHIFIFILAVAHVLFSVITVVFGMAKIGQWKQWEDDVTKDNFDHSQVLKPKITHVKDQDFIKNRYFGMGKRSTIRGWLRSFFKQFKGSVTKSDYVALRLGFITSHCKSNPKFKFHKYMIRALEDDFKTVVGISWYLWLYVVLFLLMNVDGLHLYFYISFIPLILLLAVGTKLEHIIIQLAHEVAEKHEAIEGELVVTPSDDHFWFQRPKVVLVFIQFILFQNAFEYAFFFWILVKYGFDSCIMGEKGYIITRLVIGVFIQILCSYSTLPLYALVTQMGTNFKKSIFEDHIQAKVVNWAKQAKKNTPHHDGTNEPAH
ncbi:hypothetical protein QVD17_17403 [Tagetes erecta]|uniref:MLO-like protein n=1 Tax=Tagetes erecta TaxID=13708 RepID=A0AAD8P1H0_TARER|nr:hypothetical protein QVD17_17403 [Tagetes erecta]